jgi:hypothetical protein
MLEFAAKSNDFHGGFDGARFMIDEFRNNRGV